MEADLVEISSAVNAVVNKKRKRQRKKKSGHASNVQIENQDDKNTGNPICRDNGQLQDTLLDVNRTTQIIEVHSRTNADSTEQLLSAVPIQFLVNKKRKKRRKKKSGNAPNLQTENQDDKNTGNPICGNNGQLQDTLLDVNTTTQIIEVHSRTNVDLTGQLLPAVPSQFVANKKLKKRKKKKSGNALNVQTENQDDKKTGNPICGNNGQLQDTLLDVNTTTQIIEVHSRTNVDSTGQLLPAGPFQFLQTMRTTRRKLLILDLNGLLADIVLPPPLDRKSNINICGRAIFKRPFYYDFLSFCFERFDVGVWSSRSKRIVVKVVDYLFGNLKHRLHFCWDMIHCTTTRFKTLENKHKPLVFKELRKLWETQYDNLPWERGYYNESNTVLLDDSPYKALLNPVNTSIFPFTFSYKDNDDKSLGPGGDLRVYLEGLATAENVRTYIELNPFGQLAINENSSLWHFYSKVLSKSVSLT